MEFLERPSGPGKPRYGLVMTHGAGGNADGPMLIAMARALAARGWLVLRWNLAFRRQRPGGPPRPADAARDRESLREAVASIRPMVDGPVWLGGHSYGGRQASMLAAEDASVAAGLLLCSYPLHPPGKPDRLRTEHLPKITLPALFVHGTKDAFGSPDEMRAAVKLVRGPARIEFIEGAGHDLNRGRNLDFLARLEEMARA